MSTELPAREEPKITWYQVAPWCIGLLVAIGDMTTGYALWKAGIPFFLVAWARTTLKWSVVIFLGGVIWYKLWLNVIEEDEKYRGVPDVMDDTYRKALFEPYGAAMCPECETMMYYQITEPWQKDNAILTCPKCGHIFSFVWCEKCGMGGDFVQNIEDKPTSWECPGCHTIYPLPPKIWEYTFEPFLEEQLPYSTQLAKLYSQKQRRKQTALSVVWFFAGYGFLYTLVEPLERVFERAFSFHGSGVPSGSMIIMYLCFSIAVLMGFATLPVVPWWLWRVLQKVWRVEVKKDLRCTDLRPTERPADAAFAARQPWPQRAK